MALDLRLSRVGTGVAAMRLLPIRCHEIGEKKGDTFFFFKECWKLSLQIPHCLMAHFFLAECV
jgi:hypothetical protein